jgi:predicted alpha/beta hydrolase family esterase
MPARAPYFVDRASAGTPRVRHEPTFPGKAADDDSEAPVTVLVVPGLHGSEDAHWQTWLEKTMPSARRVVQRDWSRPSLKEWCARLRDEIDASEAPVVLVGHSFGCLTIAETLIAGLASPTDDGHDRVAAALLVAPANPARFGIDPERLRASLSVTSITVGSQNDPWMQFDDVRRIAQCWGSSLINLGNAGHINVAAGFGPWQLGRELTEMLCWQARRDAVTISNTAVAGGWTRAA